MPSRRPWPCPVRRRGWRRLSVPDRPNVTVSVLFSSNRTVAVSAGVLSDGWVVSSNDVARSAGELRHQVFGLREIDVLPRGVLPRFLACQPSSCRTRSSRRRRLTSIRFAVNDRPSKRSLRRNSLACLAELREERLFDGEDLRARDVLRETAAFVRASDDQAWPSSFQLSPWPSAPAGRGRTASGRLSLAPRSSA